MKNIKPVFTEFYMKSHPQSSVSSASRPKGFTVLFPVLERVSVVVVAGVVGLDA